MRKHNNFNIHKLWRNPRTNNENKQYFGSVYSENSVQITVRGKRRPIYLPGSHEEIVRSNYKQRNWKAYRKNQWKGK